ncbi:MAG: hypothetical protein V2A66_08705 [Pseudomonadota bacterium]
MKKRLMTALSLLILVSSCSWFTSEPPKTQLQIREFQTRTFDTKDPKLVIKALLNVLQDEGFIIKNADANLGFLSATKEVDLGGGSPFGFSWGTTNNSKEPARWNKLSVIDATANVSEYGKQCRVRVNFQKKILDNLGAVVEAGPIDDGNYYQIFFEKVDKGIFLQKENL